MMIMIINIMFSPSPGVLWSAWSPSPRRTAERSSSASAGPAEGALADARVRGPGASISWSALARARARARTPRWLPTPRRTSRSAPQTRSARNVRLTVVGRGWFIPGEGGGPEGGSRAGSEVRGTQ